MALRALTVLVAVLIFVGGCISKESLKTVSKEQALRIAMDHAKFLGTWINIKRRGHFWIISAVSSSARA